MSKKKYLFLKFLPLIIIILIWQIYVGHSKRLLFLFSSPEQIFWAIYKGVKDGYLLTHTWITFIETICGFIIGNFTGILIGLGLWGFKRLANILRPYIIAFGTIPIFAIAPIMIVWFGIGIFSKIMMAAISTFVIALVQSYEGAMNVDKKYLNIMKIYGANKVDTFVKVVVPSSLIWVFSSLKLNIGFALLGAFIGEFISAEKGLGYFILKASGLYDMANVFSGLFFYSGLALILSFFLGIIEKKIIYWR